MTTGLLTIVLLSRGRAFALPRAARAIYAQRGFRRALEVIGLDLSADGSAIGALRALAHEAPVPFAAIVAPKAQGPQLVARALQHARGAHIAFLTEDDEAPQSWLSSLLAAHQGLAADATAGPVLALLPREVRRGRRYFARAFSVSGPAMTGVAPGLPAFDNIIMTRAFAARCATSPPGPQGAEPGLAMLRAAADGARFVWAAEAALPRRPARSAVTLDHALAAARARERAAPHALPGAIARYLGAAALAGLANLTLAPGRRSALTAFAAASGALDSALAPARVRPALPPPANDAGPVGPGMTAGGRSTRGNQ